MFQNKITYKEFCDYMDEIEAVKYLDDDLVKACDTFNGKTRYSFGTEFPILVDTVIELLEIIFGDKKGVISYFVYELDFGKDNSIPFVDDNGYGVELESVSDLWNYLMQLD